MNYIRNEEGPSLLISWILKERRNIINDNTHNFDNLYEIDQFLERDKPPKLTQEKKTDQLSRPILIKEI